MLSSLITRWNEAQQRQAEVDAALTEKLMGALYRARTSVASGHNGIVIPFVTLGEMNTDAHEKFAQKVCGSAIFQCAAEALGTHGFDLVFSVDEDKKRITLAIQISQQRGD